jgi:hypothetical protein
MMRALPILAICTACTSGVETHVSQNAKPLGDVARQATIKPDSLLFPRDGNDDLAAVPVGTVLISDWQDGYLRTVMDVQDDGAGKLTLMTEQASLTDIVDSGESQATIDFSTLSQMARLWPGVDASAGTTFNIPLDGKQIYSDESLGLSVKIGKGSIQLSPSLDLGLTIHGGTSFHAVASGQITADLELVVKAGKAVNKQFVVTLWESPEFSVPLPPIGPIPISAQAKLIVQAGLDVSAEGQVTVTMGASTTADISYGLRYEGGAWSQQGDTTASWQPTTPSLTTEVNAHAKIYVSAGVQVGLYGGIHLLKLGAGGAAGFSVEPYVAFDYPAQNSPWAITAGFTGHYWALLTILDKKITGIDQPGDQLFVTKKQIYPTDSSTIPMNPGNCGDGVQDGVETDLDCGGASCSACDIGRSCIADTDCSSGNCTNGVCVRALPFTCSDGFYNGDETLHIDCGGSCLACTTEMCSADSDCASGMCDTVASACLPPITCYDGIKDGDEPSVDCGGSCDPFFQCTQGQACATAADCVGRACAGETDEIAVTGTCTSVPWNCFDCIQDGDETGLDCGGSCAIEPLLQCQGYPPVSVLSYFCN